jgi:hypothetical protein
MKKAILPALILMSAFYFSCAKKKTNVEFDVPYTYSVAIPALTKDVPVTFTTQTYATNIGDKLSSNGTNGNLVGEMHCTTFSVAASSPTIGTGSTLSYIRSMKFYVNAPNQPEIQMSYKYNEKKSGTTWNDTIYPTDKSTKFHVNENNLKNRFIESGIFFKVKVDPLYSTPATTITVTHTLHVKAITEK